MTATTETTKTAAAESPAGNMSMRELARALTKGAETSTAEKTATTGGENEQAEANTETTEREQSSTETGGAAEAQAEGIETAEAGQQTEPAEATSEETEEAASTGTGEAATGLPEELSDAMEVARADGKTGTAKLLKRVHRLVDERDTQRNQRLAVEEQLEQMRREVSELREQKTAPRESVPAGMHPEVAKVVSEIQKVDAWLMRCRANRDGMTVPDGKGGEISLDAEQVDTLREQLTNERTDLATQRRLVEHDVQAAFAASHAQFHRQALEVFPFYKDAKSPESIELQAILKVFPQLKSSPDYEIVLGHYFRGKALYEAEQKAKAKGNGGVRKATAAREPTKVLAEAPGGAVSAKPAREKSAEESEKAFAKSGSTKDLAKMFAAKARAQSR
jgi:hypothetical protein